VRPTLLQPDSGGRQVRVEVDAHVLRVVQQVKDQRDRHYSKA
jgi:hypothetical protein